MAHSTPQTILDDVAMVSKDTVYRCLFMWFLCDCISCQYAGFFLFCFLNLLTNLLNQIIPKYTSLGTPVQLLNVNI